MSKEFTGKELNPHWPSQIVDEFVDFIPLLPGDKATICIEAKSFVRVFIYKMKSEDPVVKLSINQDNG